MTCFVMAYGYSCGLASGRSGIGERNILRLVNACWQGKPPGGEAFRVHCSSLPAPDRGNLFRLIRLKVDVFRTLIFIISGARHRRRRNTQRLDVVPSLVTGFIFPSPVRLCRVGV